MPSHPANTRTDVDTSMSQRPAANEYAAYYQQYIDRVPAGDIVNVLKDQLRSTSKLLAAIPADRHDHRYAADRWSIKEVLGHILHVEWVFTYRALRIPRGDQTPMASMDQDLIAAGSNVAERGLEGLIEDLHPLRSANPTLFEGFSPQLLARTGTASGNRFSVRGLLYVIAGHELHHLGVLTERYL